MNFIYALNEDDKLNLINNGFNFICEQKLNNQKVYLFENNNDKMYVFSNEDKCRYLITNKMYF